MPPPALDIPAIDTAVESAIREGKLPGAVVTVGRREGVIFERAYGRRSLTPRRSPMRKDTIFDLASLTKAVVTATSIALLAERGALDLDDRAARHLGEVTQGHAARITLRELLTHSSGLARVNPLRDYAGGPEAAMAKLLSLQTEVRPGTRYRYSDIGYLWLGKIVERVAGQALDEFARREIFEPLAMRDSGFRPAPELRARIAPTEVTDKRPKALIHGEVHDPRAYRLGGVAGNAGAFSTAADLARFARMMLGGGELEGRRVLARSSVETLTRPHFIAGTVRSPGWDIDSDYSGPRGHMLSGRAFGHGGFTGTSMWIDPGRDLFVIVLSNRVHPDGKGNVLSLAAEVADAAARTVTDDGCPSAPAPVRAGIDVLQDRGFERLAGKRVGLLTHLAARDRQGRPTLEVLAEAENVKLAAVFSPEHGLTGQREGAIASGLHPELKTPVHSLFGKKRKPTPEQLAGLDLLVVDLVDVGTRFYTYMSTVQQVMVAAAEQGLPLMILDRPNPLGGAHVEGPLLDADIHSFVNYHRLPLRHGMTVGELASFLAAEDDIGVELEVVEVTGWQREMLFEATGLQWFAPSPNLPAPTSALLYPAVGLLESTNVSVGRGTDSPFELLGAPFIDGEALAAALSRRGLPGVRFEPARFIPRARPHAGALCEGIRLHISQPGDFRAASTGLALARELIRQHPKEFQAKELIKLLGHRKSLQSLLRGGSPAAIERTWRPDLAAFETRRRLFLRYPTCGS
ncbi:MAG: DUF1343 domain-containing protein [Myxococcales bacterium]|nr:DUF1343 domain-containing protein [Myxococcales bacterium]